MRGSAKGLQPMSVILLGLDPGLRNTGWGVIEVTGCRLRHIADGVVRVAADRPMSDRLVVLHDALVRIIEHYRPQEAAVEETFVNKNPASTLKLGHARGVVLLVPARAGLPVAEYSANRIKKSVTGVGHADKAQVQMMVKTLLPAARVESSDAADALAAAICHAHYMGSRRYDGSVPVQAGVA